MRNIWFDARNMENSNLLIPKVFNLNYDGIIVNINHINDINIPQKMQLILDVDLDTEYDNQRNYVILSKDEKILDKYKSEGNKTALAKTITSKEEMEAYCLIAEKFDFFVVSFVDETNIPLEYVLATLQEKNTKIIKVVSNTREASVSFGVMEMGSHGIAINNNDIHEVIALNDFIETKKISAIELVTFEVTNVKPVGMGHRVCIDTTTVMKKDEGMLIGSTSSGGILICSETHDLPYMDLRPFRVNAGAIHSYVWSKNNSTPYLSELKSGDEVMCVDKDGKSRLASIGRIKIEIRPLIKIEAKYQDVSVNVMVQDDWNIRILAPEGKTLNASNIAPGDKVLGYVCNPGRHAGIQIDEFIEEK